MFVFLVPFWDASCLQVIVLKQNRKIGIEKQIEKDHSCRTLAENFQFHCCFWMFKTPEASYHLPLIRYLSPCLVKPYLAIVIHIIINCRWIYCVYICDAVPKDSLEIQNVAEVLAGKRKQPISLFFIL